MSEVTIDEVPKSIRDLFNKGFAALEHGNLDYAVDLLYACVEQEPRFLQARRFLRAAEIRRFKEKKGGGLSGMLTEVTGMPVYLNALAKLKGGDPEAALHLTEALLRKAPLNMKFVLLFAQAAANADRPEVAIQTLEIARDHNPNNIRLLNWLGALYQKVGRTKSARECFETLCAISPNDPETLKALKDAIALDSTMSWEDTAEKGGSYRDLIHDVEEAKRLEQEAKARRSERDDDVLIKDMLDKISAEPNNANYYRALAGLYTEIEEFDLAVQSLRSALKITPGDPELDNMINTITLQKYDQEVEQLRAAGDTQAADDREAEREQFAFNNLQDRVKRYPNDLRLRFEWGLMLKKHGHLNEAIQQFQMSQRNMELRVRALFNMGMCFKDKEQYDLAAEQLGKAAAEIPIMDANKKDITYELGSVYEITGNIEKAEQYYKEIYQADIGYKDIADKMEQIYKAKQSGDT